MSTRTATRHAASWRVTWDRLGPTGRLLAVAGVSRVLVIVAAALAGAFVPSMEPLAWNRGPPVIQYFARWDSGFYLDIAEQGYGFKPEAWAFNPGYPLLIALVHALLPFVDATTAGFIISHAAFFGVVPLVYAFTRDVFDESFAWRATLLFIAFPGSFYLSAVYADALFLLLFVGALLAVHRARWITAGVLTSAAAFTRPPGIFLIGVIGVAFLVRSWRAGRIQWRPLTAFPFALALPGALMLYAWRETGNAFIQTDMREVYWPNVQWRNPVTTLLHFEGPPEFLKPLMFLGLALVLFAAAWSLYDGIVRRRVDAWPVYAFTLVITIIYVGYSEWNPIIRYLLPVIPLYWALADRATRRPVFLGVLAVSFILQLFVTAVFAAWGELY